MFKKYAKLENAQVLGVWSSPTSKAKTASLDKLADFDTFRTSDGFIYTRVRAISSRINKNNDGWPSIELAGGQDIFDRHRTASQGGGFTIEASKDHQYGFSTFLHKPAFVDHNNYDPKRARGVVVDARLHVEDNKTAALDPYYSSEDVDPSHLPPTWVELLIETDAKAFPKLAQALVEGSKDPSKGINGVSMGTNCGYTTCSVPTCRKKASTAADFCEHIAHMKGATVSYKDQTGRRKQCKVYENCHDLGFFEISYVFDPADETALMHELRTASVKTAEASPDAGEVHILPAARSGNGRHQVMVIDHHGNSQWPTEYETGRYGWDNPEAIVTPSHILDQAHQYAHALDNNPHNVTANEYGLIPFYRPGQEMSAPPQHPDPWMDNEPGSLTIPEHWGSRKTADNPPPQSDMEKAPQSVDTLRDETVCPVCGSLQDGDTCSVCGYTSPPEGMDNPDLSKAKDMKAEIDHQHQHDPTAQPEPLGGDIQPSPEPSPQHFQSPFTPSPNNSPTTARVNIEPMKWELSLHPKQAGKINTGERPILPGNPPVSNEPNETIIRDYPKPTTAMTTARSMMAAAQQRSNMKQADNAPSAASPGGPVPEAGNPDTKGDVEGVGGYIQDSNESASKADAQVDVEGIGGTGVEGVAADETQDVTRGDAYTKNVEEIHTQTWNDGKGDSLGQHEPVTNDSGELLNDSGSKATYRSNTHTAYESGPGDNLISDPEPGQAPGADPADPVGKAQERVDLTDATTSPDNNSGPTKTWSGTGGNGVTKQQDPVTNEVPWSQDPKTNAGINARSHLLAALKLAETEIELGLINPEQKFARIAEIEGESPEGIRAALKFAARVKQAGLQKKVAKVAKVPSFSHPVNLKEGSVSLTDLDDSAIFS